MGTFLNHQTDFNTASCESEMGHSESCVNGRQVASTN